MTEVLAVPGPPTRRVLLWDGSFLFSDLMTGSLAIFEMIYSALVESAVGIRSWEKAILFGGAHASALQRVH